MPIIFEPIVELNWSNDTGLTLPLYFNISDLNITLAIRRWWRLRKQGALDIDDAMDYFSSYIDSYNKLPSIKNSRNKISFSTEYPQFLFDDDSQAEHLDHNNIVVWQLVRREPGSLATQPFRRPRELKPRIREILTIPNNDDPTKYDSVEIRGQWFDNLIRFDCWAPTAKEANNLADTFERLLQNVQDMLLRAGVQKIVYMGRTQDRYQLGSRWHYRPISVYFRTEQIHINSDRAISQIDYETFNILESVNVVGISK